MLAMIFAGVARAYQIAPPQLLAAFDYIYVVSAVIWAFVFFAEVTDIITIAGVVLIIQAGLLVASSVRQPVRTAAAVPD